MTTEVKVKLTALSVALAFVIQLIGSVWFLSGLSGALNLTQEATREHRLRIDRLEIALSGYDLLRDKTSRIEADVKEIKADIKELARR